MRRTPHHALKGSMIAITVASAAPAVAVNGYSFLDAGTSAIRYYQADIGPIGDCAALVRHASVMVGIETAVVIPATPRTPGYCKINGTIQPEIRFELRLPLKWNRRLYMLGNGGYGGQPLETFYADYRDRAIENGFATVMTNTGHDAQNEPGATFAYHNLQKKMDWAFRAVHLTAVEAKALVQVYYGRPQAFSYFDGCSNGGRQGLISAQRYPGDFDGIVAGAPLANFTDTTISYLWTSRALNKTPIPETKMPLIAATVMRLCDGQDGLKDGLISDPRTCNFNPVRDLPHCGPAGGQQCFSDAELATLTKIYTGPVSGGRPYSHGVLPGAEPEGVIYLPPSNVETGWFEWVSDPRGPMYYQGRLSEDFVRYMAYPTQDASARAADFNFDTDPVRMDAGRAMVDALNPDLAEFQRRGGKLLMYHGWADLGISPLNTIDYYEAAKRANGGSLQNGDFMRLFMMPGVFHCFGGYGPDRLDALTALVNWVEMGTAPDVIVATKTERHNGGKIVRTRPICAYPKIARYKGSGSIDQAGNFTCVDAPAPTPAS